MHHHIQRFEHLFKSNLTLQFLSWSDWFVARFCFTYVNCFRISVSTEMSGSIFESKDFVMFMNILCRNYGIGPPWASISSVLYSSFPSIKQDLSSLSPQTSAFSNNLLPIISVNSLLLTSNTLDDLSSSTASFNYPSIPFIQSSSACYIEMKSCSKRSSAGVTSPCSTSPLTLFEFRTHRSLPSISTIYKCAHWWSLLRSSSPLEHKNGSLLYHKFTLMPCIRFYGTFFDISIFAFQT